MNARDIPVLGDLCNSVIEFVTTLRRIAPHPFAFVHTISFDDPEELKRAFKFIGAGIALAYLVITPALSKYDRGVNEFLFGSLVLFRILLVVVIYHLVFLIIGRRQPFKKSLILGSYINGIYFPFLIAAMLPILLVVGPDSVFDAQSKVEYKTEQTPTFNDWLSLLSLLIIMTAVPLFYAVTSYWWAKVYETKIWLSAVLLFVAVFLAWLANYYIISPLMRPFV